MAATKAAKRKDPNGGLTAAGRRYFKEKEGADLKPGVKRAKTPQEMRRKGSFLRRHYGRKTPSPLKDEHGQPTRYALQAHAWGEPAPTTQAAVRRLAKKGTTLLERYDKSQKKGSRDTAHGRD